MMRDSHMHEHGNQLLQLLQLWVITRNIYIKTSPDDRTARRPRSSRGRISIRIRNLQWLVRNNDDKIADRGGISDPLIQFVAVIFFTQTAIISFWLLLSGGRGRSAPAFLTRNRPDVCFARSTLPGLLLACYPGIPHQSDGWMDRWIDM